MILTKEQRLKLQKHVGEQCLANMFGDGQERDYVIDGFPAFKGVANMTDDELLEEAGYDWLSGLTFEQFFEQLESGEDTEEDSDEE